jgi:hypothetical protein
VDPPHPAGEAFGVITFGVVEPDEFLGAQGRRVRLEPDEAAGDETENALSSRKALAAVEGWTQLIE